MSGVTLPHCYRQDLGFLRAPQPTLQIKGSGKSQLEVKGGGKKGKGGKSAKGGKGQKWVTEMMVNGQKKTVCACVFRQVRAHFQIANFYMHVQCHWAMVRLVDKLIRPLSTSRCHTDSESTQQTVRFQPVSPMHDSNLDSAPQDTSVTDVVSPGGYLKMLPLCRMLFHQFAPHHQVWALIHFRIQRIFLDVCSGSSRPLSTALKKHNVDILSFDILLDLRLDLLDDSKFLQLLKLLCQRSSRLRSILSKLLGI